MEHRLFSHITLNWRGRPLTSHDVVVQTIAATTTRRAAARRCWRARASRRADRLTPTALARLQAALAAGDRHGQVATAWWAAQQLCLGYAIADPAAGRAHAELLIPTLVSCPVPEVARVGRTLATWRRDYLAYSDTNRVSNGPTEAIHLLIEKIRRVGHGYRNWHNYRLRLVRHCGVTWDSLLHHGSGGAVHASCRRAG